MIKLLIVDDSALMRRLLGRIFADEPDFEVATARNGVEALARLQELQPDVVTLDVHMPEMDGLACLDRIMRERPCPVVMVSALTARGADVTLQALELGAVDFISKPDGAPSLAMEEFAPLVRDKIRAAASARLRGASRLAERLRSRMEARPAPVRSLGPIFERTAASGRGLPEGVVLVGCSTGGPPALEALLTRLPGDFPWPIVVAQHMPSSFTAQLARRLDKLCALDVVECAAPQPVVAGQVLIARGDGDLILARRSSGLIAMPAPSLPQHRWHPSVTRLVESAMAHVAAARLIGILMTGMGNDGAAAMARLHAGGGRTIAEAEQTAVVWGMPGELVRLGAADVVAPVDTIAVSLIDMLH